MKLLNLRFSGRFEDAFLYMGYLFLVTENHSMRVYDMQHVTRRIEEDDLLLDVPTLFFLRNDTMEDARFKYKRGGNPGKEAFLQAINRFHDLEIVIEEHNFNYVEWDLEIPANILLDLNIYNSRAYIGADTGLYHLDLDCESETVSPIGKTQKRLDTKCIHTTAKYGTVNASCGAEGLFSFLDDFDLGETGSKRSKTISEWSLRTSWLDYDLINYTTTTSSNLLSGRRTAPRKEVLEKKKNLEQEQWIVTDIGERSFHLNTLFQNLEGQQGFNTEDIQFVQNSSKALFLSTYDNNLYALGLERSSVNSPRISYLSRYEGLGGLVSSIHTINAGFNRAGLVLETDSQILLFANRQFIPVFDGEAISIRSFSRSKHYKNLISITTADEVLLIAVCDEASF